MNHATTPTNLNKDKEINTVKIIVVGKGRYTKTNSIPVTAARIRAKFTKA
jgi:hypothetical protein